MLTFLQIAPGKKKINIVLTLNKGLIICILDFVHANPYTNSKQTHFMTDYLIKNTKI